MNAIEAELANVDAITAFNQVKAQVATPVPAEPAAHAPGSTTPTDTATRLLAAARQEVTATNRKTLAESRYESARKRLAAIAIDLYTNSAAQAGSSNDTTTSPAELMSVMLNQESRTYGAAKRDLALANRGLTQAKVAAKRAVAAQAATIRPHLRLASADPATSANATPTSSSAGPSPAAPSLSILGPTTLTAGELAGWFAQTGHTARLTEPLSTLAQDYVTVGTNDGVRADIAFAQTMLETDYLEFPGGGLVAPSNNNFAGIGACDSCAQGWAFPNAMAGVAAQLQLLHEYASTQQVPGPLPNAIGASGCCTTWLALSGVWATNPDYGYHILLIYQKMLKWALGQATRTAGL